jgi:hypothetical protein
VHCHRFDEKLLDELAATLSSYLGHFKLANSRGLLQSLWKRFAFLSEYFAFDKVRWRLVRKHPMPKEIRMVRRQYRYFRWQYPEDVLFFQVGPFMEFYDIGEHDWIAPLGLRRMRWNRRGARYGFPASQIQHRLEILLAQGRRVTLIGEQPGEPGATKSRALLYRFVARSAAA